MLRRLFLEHTPSCLIYFDSLAITLSNDRNNIHVVDFNDSHLYDIWIFQNRITASFDLNSASFDLNSASFDLNSVLAIRQR